MKAGGQATHACMHQQVEGTAPSLALLHSMEPGPLTGRPAV
jgi:hypothetical protein